MAEKSGNDTSEQDTQRLMSDCTEESNENLTDLPVFKEPLCLIENDESGVLKINEDVLHQLSKIDTTTNVIAIAGPYRSGKSFLMNRLAGSKTGFPLGKTIDSATKGIWVWCQCHPINKDQILILLDTEGIGDATKKDETNDYNILCLTALLSSTFVYNIIGVINRETLEKLGFVTYFARRITVYHDKQQDAYSSDIGLYLPKFVLCLRDFSHDLGNQTPDDYLQSRLSLSDTKQGDNEKFNQIRACIQCFFTNRKCCIFDPPASGRTKLSRLEELDEKDISEEFLKDAQVFIDYIYACQPKQLLDGKMLNGRMFSMLTRNYVEVIKAGGIPCIDNALTSMAKHENSLAVRAAVEVFKRNMQQVQIPISDMNAFEKIYRKAQEIGLQEYRSKSVLDTEKEFSKSAEKEMDDIRQKYIEESRLKQQTECKNELQNIYDTGIKQKISNGDYNAPDGYRKYKDDFAEMRSEIKRRLPHADENMLKICILDFEDKHRDQDEELLNKAEMSRKEMSENLIQIENEKAQMKDEIKAQVRDEMKKFNAWKVQIEEKRVTEKEEIQAKYREAFKKWEDEKKTYQDNLQEQNERVENLLSLLKSEIESNKPSVTTTFMATVANLVPVVGPIGYQVGKHVHQHFRSQQLEKDVSKAGPSSNKTE